MNLKKQFDIKLSDLTLDNIGTWPEAIKVVIYIAIFVLVLILSYRIDLSKKMMEWDDAEHKEETLKNEFTQKQHMASNLEAYQQQVNKIEAQLKDFLTRLPTQTEIPGLLEDISKTGLSNGLEFNLFKPLPEVKRDFYAELPIEISVTGDFHQIAEFISQIASLNRIVTLHDFSLAIGKNIQTKNASSNSSAKPNTSTQDNKLTLEIKAKTYRYLGRQDVKK